MASSVVVLETMVSRFLEDIIKVFVLVLYTWVLVLVLPMTYVSRQKSHLEAAEDFAQERQKQNQDFRTLV